MDDPLVTCVMVTGGKGREWWAHRSFRSFLRQKGYPNRELLVINESGETPWEYRVTTSNQGDRQGLPTREIVLPFHSHTVGQMRNIGKSEASGAWILQWDDDDWFHETRVREQMKFREEDCCQVLFAQVRYSTVSGTAYTYSNPGTGIAGTILHPRTDFLYPSQTNNEDTLFLLGRWEGKIKVLDNYACPHLYIRFHHGDNLNHAKHVMRKYAERKWRGRWVDLPEQWGWMSRHAVAYLRHVLPTHYSIPVPPLVWVDVLARRRKQHVTDAPIISGLMEEE
jgi:hypothetical protein